MRWMYLSKTDIPAVDLGGPSDSVFYLKGIGVRGIYSTATITYHVFYQTDHPLHSHGEFVLRLLDILHPLI